MRVLLARFACEESGTTTIGYALIAAGMSVAIITALSGPGIHHGASSAGISSPCRRLRGHSTPNCTRISQARGCIAAISIDAGGCGF